jgi:hypothetical protein
MKSSPMPSTVGLFEDFRPRRQFVRQRVVRVAELVDEVGALLLGDALAHVLVVLRVALADVGACQDNLRAHCAQVEDLLLAHLVGQDENELVALLRRHQRQADARVARRRLDQRVAGRDVAALLGLFDHRDADAVLDRAAGIREFELE